MLNGNLLRLSFAALLFYACSVEPAGTEKVLPVGEDTLVCTIDNFGDVRTSLDRDNVPVWEEGDELSVFGSDGVNRRFTLTDGAGTSTASFNGTLPLEEMLTAFYPYSASNSAADGALKFSTGGTVDAAPGRIPGNCAPMVATFSGVDPVLSFSNVFGILKIQLCGTATVGSLSVTSLKEGEMLWGNCSLAVDEHVGTDSQNLGISGGNGSITLRLPSPVRLSESVPESFLLPLPAGTLSEGFRLGVCDASGSVIYSVTTEKDRRIIRSAIREMDTVYDVDGESSDDVVPEPFTWSAYNNLARTGTEDETVIDPETSGYPQRRSDRYVGIFYFVWQGQGDGNFGALGGLPCNIQNLLDAKHNPAPGTHYYEYDPYLDYREVSYAHHWGEPYLGYYVADDAWVIRKHAQMLVDAGVDFITLDLTNGIWYPLAVATLCNVYRSIRDEGGKTPYISLMFHSAATTGIDYADAYFYSKPEYSDLWFKWEGKPVIFCGTDAVNKPGYTMRRSWYLWNSQWQTEEDANDPWWGVGADKGVDRWPWGCCYTADTEVDGMKAGTHNGENEFASVMPATHPSSNIGRSYPVNRGIGRKSGAASYVKQPARGIYFKSQFKAAKALDPKIMFFTGWNEWVAQRWSSNTLDFSYVGGEPEENNTIFVDQYNHEFSRDIEPLAGDYGDTYYYYLADFIRQFKGVDNIPVYSRKKSVSIDGEYSDWMSVASCYADDCGDVRWQGYENQANSRKGWGAVTLSNMTGRNDLHLSKIATDGTNLFFYLKAKAALRDYDKGETGLNLYIKAGSVSSGWEGFNFRVMPGSEGSATLYRTYGGWNWEKVTDTLPLAVKGAEMELSIPLSLLGADTSRFSVDFKWVDNADLSAEDGIQRCMRDGDSAPNGRFKYRYNYKQQNNF